MQQTIGIPKSLLFYKYRILWKCFFEELGCKIIYSPKTDKNILEKGKSFIVDESCLAMKIWMGHFDFLTGKCDYILVPHIASLVPGEELCTNFYALYDLTKNIFNNSKILNFHIDINNGEAESKAFISMGKTLGFKRKEILEAYKKAKEENQKYLLKEINNNKNKLEDKRVLKILIVSHPYNIYDEFIGKPIIDFLEKLKINIIYAHLNNQDIAYKEISRTLYWTFSKELVNGVEAYKNDVDGIILLSSYPCGPDSLVNEIIVRKVNIPIIQLIIDEQDAGVGIETRLESFVDILTNMKKVDK